MPPLKAQLLLEESLSAYFPEMVFTDSGITVQLHRNTQSALPRLGRAFLGRGGMDCCAGPAAALDAGLTACRAALGDSRRGHDRLR